jgi:hypothetical protein
MLLPVVRRQAEKNDKVSREAFGAEPRNRENFLFQSAVTH